MSAPLVTISVLSFERKDTLRRVLETALDQHYPRLEILVVDNASTDGSDRMVAEEFPDVELVRLPENVGCAARNAGVAAARGDIVVTLDNDVLLATPDGVAKAVEVFNAQPSVACVNFKILGPDGKLSLRDWCHPRDWRVFADEEFPTSYVLEGASAFRRDIFNRVGGYWALLFLGHEGLDLALRLLDGGYDLVYSPRVRVTHLASPTARPSSRIYYTFTRNGIWVALRNHRTFAATRSVLMDLALMAFSSFRGGEFRSWLRGVRDGIRGSARAMSCRRPLSRRTYRKLKSIKSGEPSLLAKAIRHFWERPI